jgi:hypothetical protein
MPKQKFSFTIDGVIYTDISGYDYAGRYLSITVSGTAQMIRQWLKRKYPNLPSKNYVWVQSESYAGGDSIRVYLNNAPEEFATKIARELKDNFQEGYFDGSTDSYSYTKSEVRSSEGQNVRFGTKYLFVNNKKPYDSDAPEVDWSVLSKASAPAKTSTPRTTSSQPKSYPMGEVLKDCSGWIIYKKTLPDGRIVYNAKIKPETSPNRTDWNAIKGEIYTETGFKWGRFGAFEKWGVIASEAAVVELLCKILGKYYQGGDAPAKPDMPEPEPTPATTPEQPSGKGIEINIYIDGMFFEKAESLPSASDILSKKFGQPEFESMYAQKRLAYDTDRDRIDVLTRNFKYGKNWDVPEQYGNELQVALVDYNFKIYVVRTAINIYKKDSTDAITIIDNGGEFNLYRFDESDVFLGSINYVANNTAITPQTLASLIREIYVDTFEVPKSEEKPAEVPTEAPTKSKEDIEKAIKGLQYLADKGNEKAIKAIKGLKYLLNK